MSSTGTRSSALDGVRGLALILILLFHFELGPFRGGFAALTMFFTLSGFLICSRTLMELRTTGRFQVLRFFERRVRRLAPAALVCLLLVLLLTRLVGNPTQQAEVPGDALGALLNVANWRFLAQGTDYAHLFQVASPLNHYWSLAVEEQFYLAFPIGVALVMALPRRMRSTAAITLVSVLCVVSVAVGASAGSYNRFYYGTDTRAFELLLGVLLALVLHHYYAAVRYPTARQTLATTLGGLTALAMLGYSLTVFRNGEPTFQHGGTVLVAIATAMLIVSCLDVTGFMARLMSLRPLAWTGKVSYGAYLYHWPIYALFGRHWGPIHGVLLSCMQLALTFILAALSYRYIEQPVIKRRTLPRPRSLVRAWLTSAAMLSVVILGLSVVHPSTVSANPAGLGPTSVTDKRVLPKVVLPRTDGPKRPLRVAVVGDSTAEVMAIQLVNEQNAHPDQLQVLNLSQSGCPFTTSNAIKYYSGESGRDVRDCSTSWHTTVPEQVRAFQPDVSAVFLSLVEQADQLSPADGAWHNDLDPVWRDHQEQMFRELVSDLEITGAPVAWADAPYCKFQQDLPWFGDAPERTDALNGIYANLAASAPKFTLLPYASRLNKPNHEVDLSIRPDGVHMGLKAAHAMFMQWLLPVLQTYHQAPSGIGS